MKRLIFICLITTFIVLSLNVVVFSAPSVEEILKRVDYNQSPESVIYEAKMVIHQGERVNTKEMRLYGKGEEKSYALFLSPQRDKGTAVLRLDDNLWLYLPSADKTIKIAGHMLRQSFMGSDFSYEDSTERVKLLEKYEANLVGVEDLDGQDVFYLVLKAKRSDATYFERRLWVDTERFVVLKQEMYGKSGKMLKLMTASEFQKIGDRHYMTRFRMEDKLKCNTYTEMVFTDITLDTAIPESVFTKQNLERKK